MKFDISQYAGQNCAMHCPNREDAEIFLSHLQNLGRTCCDGQGYDKRLNFGRYKHRTGYAFNEGRYGTIEWCIDNNYIVLEFEDFEWDDDITPPLEPRPSASR